jgi:hypothetical protein
MIFIVVKFTIRADQSDGPAASTALTSSLLMLLVRWWKRRKLNINGLPMGPGYAADAEFHAIQQQQIACATNSDLTEVGYGIAAALVS